MSLYIIQFLSYNYPEGIGNDPGPYCIHVRNLIPFCKGKLGNINNTSTIKGLYVSVLYGSTHLHHRFEDLRQPLVEQISEIRAKMLFSPHKETAV